MTQSELTAREVEATVAIPERRWTAWVVFVTGLCQPATTARRTQHVSLLSAFLVHLLAAVGLFLVSIELAAWADRKTFAYMLGEMLEELTRDLSRHPVETGVAVVAVILAIEAVFVVLGLLFAPWGAADEPFRATARNALRQTWLHTADAIPLVLAVGAMAVAFDFQRRAWWSQDQAEFAWEPMPAPTPPTAPWYASGQSPTTQEVEANNRAVAAFNQAMLEYNMQYQQHWQEQQKRMPWFVHYGDAVAGVAGCAAGVWFLWAVLRAVGSPRSVAPIPRSPMCEMCGYNLTTMPIEARCPECGQPVVDSLGPGVRPGTSWERRRELGGLAAYLLTAIDGCRRNGLGRQMVVSSRRVAHRTFFALHLAALFAIGDVALLACYYIDTHDNPFGGTDPEIGWLVAPVFGLFCAVTILAGTFLAAGAIGVLVGLSQKRNLMPAAMQAAAYLSPYLTLCGLLSTFSAAAMFWLNKKHAIRGLQVSLHIDDEVLSFFGWLIPSGLMALGYLILIYRTTWEARFANR